MRPSTVSLVGWHLGIVYQYVFVALFQSAVLCLLNTHLGVSEATTATDSNWFSINWPGSISSDTKHAIKDESGTTVVVVSSNKEKYSCFIPADDIHKSTAADYEGPDVHLLINELFTSQSCSYRMESYWTYELCHGRHVKQYHGERGGDQKSNDLVFYLGHYQADVHKNEDGTLTQLAPEKRPTDPVIKTKKLENIEMPYYEVAMDHGTICELTGKPRSVKILYMCQAASQGEIYQINEVASCQYEMIVLTSKLCFHPQYKPKQQKVNQIQCHCMDGAPSQPKKYTEFFPDQQTVMRSVPKPSPTRATSQSTITTEKQVDSLGSTTDKQTIVSFFTGSHCIYGGVGWWRYEFCYGKHVSQYHKDSSGRTTIVLGEWSETKHKDWVTTNGLLHRTSQRREFVTLLYTDGNFCELSGKRRFTLVKLKCDRYSKKPHSITLYLLEPEICEYELVVESMLFCNLVNQADEYGIIKHTKL